MRIGEVRWGQQRVSIDTYCCCLKQTHHDLRKKRLRLEVLAASRETSYRLAFVNTVLSRKHSRAFDAPYAVSCCKSTPHTQPFSDARLQAIPARPFWGKIEGVWWAADSCSCCFTHVDTDRQCLIGNNVPESHQKTRRSWLPNIHNATLYSAALNKRIQIKVTTSALRDIDKVGGLDQYLTKNSFQDVLGQRGQLLREKVLKARAGVVEKEQVGENVKKMVAQLPSGKEDRRTARRA